jgi:hypothetical protein
MRCGVFFRGAGMTGAVAFSKSALFCFQKSLGPKFDGRGYDFDRREEEEEERSPTFKKRHMSGHV